MSLGVRIEDLCRSAAPKPIALVRAFEVVEVQVLGEVPLHGRRSQIVRAAERAAPQFREDGLLQAPDEAVGP